MSEAVRTVRSSVQAWPRAMVVALFVYALSGAFLQVIKISGGEGPVVPVAILGTLAILVALAVLTVGDRRLALVGAALMVVALIGTTPHDIENLSPANGIGQRVYGGLDLAIMTAALVLSGVAWFNWRRPE